jgi:hypothetical protein
VKENVWLRANLAPRVEKENSWFLENLEALWYGITC